MERDKREQAADQAERKMLLRRRILKAGAIGAPIVVSLQSSNAWSASVLCTDNLMVPENIPENGDPAGATGSLVPFNKNSLQHDQYFRQVAEKRFEGFPGHSCAASLLGIK